MVRNATLPCIVVREDLVYGNLGRDKKLGFALVAGCVALSIVTSRKDCHERTINEGDEPSCLVLLTQSHLLHIH